MRKRVHGSTVQVWLSARDTYAWAHKPGASWPGSQLSGRAVYAQFQGGDLVDFTLDRKYVDWSIDVNEFNACIEDHLGTYRPGERGTP